MEADIMTYNANNSQSDDKEFFYKSDDAHSL